MPHYHERLDPSKGRCAVASVAIQAGSCILRTPTLCAVSFVSCGWCFTSHVPFSRCTGCRKARYCSRQCQQRDWPQHRRECSAWRCLPACNNVPTVLLVTRLTATLFLGSVATEEAKHRVLQLRHHLNDHSKLKRVQFKDMTQLVLLLLSQYKSHEDTQPMTRFDQRQNDLETEIWKLFGRVHCNAFSVSNDVTNEARGIGLFPDGALFNHDCNPNCVVSFKGREMLVHVVKDVGVGQELTVSYVELLQSTDVRRRELQESYFFDCHCARCQSGMKEEVMDDWYLNGLVCSRNDSEICGGVAVVKKATDGGIDNAVCRVCGTERDVAEIDRFERQLKELETLKTASEQDKWQVYQQKWEILTRRLRLHPRNSRVAVMAREIGNFLFGATSLGLQHLALPFFLAELRAVEWLLPNMKLPSRGLLHFQIGKLLFEEANAPFSTLSPVNRAKQIESAGEHLQQSLSVLSCAYGSDSTAVQFAQSMLHEIHRTALELL